MKLDLTVVMLLLYITGSACFAAGSLIALWQHLK